jgi:Protein of unknown function (DUF2934)
MKHKRFSQSQNETSASAAQPMAAADISPSGIDFVPSPEEVARRAYFTYVNQGSMPGHDVQHWLEAEAQLLAERNLTRVHAFYKQHEANHASAHAGSARLPA